MKGPTEVEDIGVQYYNIKCPWLDGLLKASMSGWEMVLTS